MLRLFWSFRLRQFQAPAPVTASAAAFSAMISSAQGILLAQVFSLLFRNRASNDTLVHAAGSVAFQIHRDIAEAQRSEFGGDLTANQWIQKSRKLRRMKFDSRHHAVDTDPDLMKAQIQQQLFRPVYHLQTFLADGFAVDEARRKAGEGLLVPGGKAQFFGQRTDFFLTQTGVAQRAFHAQLGDSEQSRAIISVVVQILRSLCYLIIPIYFI